MGVLPVSSFLNQAFYIYSLTYPIPKPTGVPYEKEFLEGAHMKLHKKINGEVLMTIQIASIIFGGLRILGTADFPHCS